MDVSSKDKRMMIPRTALRKGNAEINTNIHSTYQNGFDRPFAAFICRERNPGWENA